MVKESVVICICGMAGSGKSTLAKKLAEKYNLKYYSGGEALKALAIEKGYKPLKKGWWESPEGLSFLENRRKNPEFDKAVDQKLLEAAKQGNAVLDSWTMPWLLEDGFKIWLEASQNKRAERVAKRDGISVEKALETLRNKEEKTRAIYKRLYGFNLGEDFTPFHLILDTDNLTAEEVFQVLVFVLDKMVFNR
ncbi:MAG: cytidylate kinase family protein [Candidatus Bathyarchaeota archaeon]|jgi:cytidylate kinase|nr:AAA family ATPase [Candidatus Bathyarchaeota archaeon A05DMB-3]MDH7606835.1 cytidylate kinase family protein [Candidatus Bathyarchaeota archaeon]PMB75341.1 MAG: cytidylate kinase [Candidatus Bathyarchaeota archaeon]